MIRIDFEAHERRLAERRAELGIEDQPSARNSGTRRTPSKRALLEAMERQAEAAGRPQPFALPPKAG